MIRAISALILAVACLSMTACGPRPKVQIKTVAIDDGPVLGPKASAEEAEGTVPPLKGIVQGKPLVPDKLVPPEPPSDPSFGPPE